MTTETAGPDSRTPAEGLATASPHGTCPDTSPERRASPLPRGAWLVVWLLVPAVLLNYLDRQMLAAMKFSVMAEVADIGSEANWGRMLGQFKWVYALLCPVGGYLADRFGRRRTVCFSLFAWSAVTWWTGQAETYHELLWARSLMGISEALYFPAALALIAAWHLGSTRSRAVGIHQIGLYSGVILGGFSGYAADTPALGWRWAFEVCGVAGMLYALPLWYFLRRLHPEGTASPPASRPAAPSVSTAVSPDIGAGNPAGSSPPREPARSALSPPAAAGLLLRNPAFLLLVVYFTLPALAGWIVRDWMPAVLKTEFGIGQGKAGVSATLFWQLAAIAGALGGGWLADRWMRRTPRGRIYVSAIGTTLLIPALFGVGFSPQTGQLWVAVSFLCLFGLGWALFDINNMPILCQIADSRLWATGYGLMNLVSISAGGLADWAFGLMRDRHLPLTGIFSAFAAAAAAAVCLVLLIRVEAPENREGSSAT